MRGLAHKPSGPWRLPELFLQAPRPRLLDTLLTSLVAHWKLEELSGNRFDSHGSNTLGDLNGVGQGTGKLGNAADFNSIGEDALGILDNAPLSMGDIDFTIAGWVLLDSFELAGVVGKWSAGSFEYLVTFDGTNFCFHVSSDGTNAVSVVNSASISTGTWYFFVAWHDAAANTINLSINNNTPAATAHSTGVHDGTSSLYLGRNEDGLAYLDGRLDSVSIWKRVLTASERAQLYNSGNGLDYPFN